MFGVDARRKNTHFKRLAVELMIFTGTLIEVKIFSCTHRLTVFSCTDPLTLLSCTHNFPSVYLGDIQFGERYEQSLAESKITFLRDEKAKFDCENHHETALTNELETTLLILTRCKQLDSALDALIQMLQNHMIDLQNSAMYAILHALVSELEHGTLPKWKLFNIINNTKREVDRREIVSAAQKQQRISATEYSETMSVAENLHFDECQ